MFWGFTESLLSCGFEGHGSGDELLPGKQSIHWKPEGYEKPVEELRREIGRAYPTTIFCSNS